MQSGLSSSKPYSCPVSGAAAGIDLTSDEIIELSNHPNCFGVKVCQITLLVTRPDLIFFWASSLVL